jgi:hypothetical protein
MPSKRLTVTTKEQDMNGVIQLKETDLDITIIALSEEVIQNINVAE